MGNADKAILAPRKLIIERRTLQNHAHVGQRTTEKRGEVVDPLVGQIQLADLEVDILDIVLAEIAAAIVELDDLADRVLSTVVKKFYFD